jgi:protein gp37
MGSHTHIGWCDSTVNPTTGCDGCELFIPGKGGPCYAGKLHEGRLAHSLPVLYAPKFTEVRLAPGRMVQAAAWSDLAGKARPDKPWLDGMPRTIFVGDMGDIFSNAIPFEYLKTELIDVATSPKGRRHIWMILTKRGAGMASFAAWLLERGIGWPTNIWAGVSITNRSSLARVRGLLCTPAKVRFLSVEPLWEDVEFGQWFDDLSWIIVGGQSGSDSHVFDVAWARKIIAKCVTWGVPCYLKQIGARPIESEPDDGPEWPVPLVYGNRGFIEPVLRDSHGADWDEWPSDLRVRQMPTPAGVPL